MADNAEKAENFIESVTGIVISTIKRTALPTIESIVKLLKRVREEILHPQESAHADMIRMFVNYDAGIEDLPPNIASALDPLLHPREQLWASVASGVATSMALTPLEVMARANIQPWQRDYLKNKVPYVLPVDVAIKYASGFPREYLSTIDRIRELGYGDDDADVIFHINKVYVDLNTLRFQLLTNKISRAEAFRQLNWQGYSEPDAMDILSNNTNVIPLNLLIAGIFREHFRETYIPTLAARLGYDTTTLNALVDISRPTLPPSDAVRAFWRGTISSKVANWHIAASGYPLEYAQTIAELTRPRATVDDIIENLFRGKLTQYQVEDELLRRGYTTADIEVMKYARYPRLDPSTIKQAALRGIITWGNHDFLLSQYGFNLSQIDIIKKLYQVIPSISDLIVMAVRDSWNEEAVKQFGYDEDYPEEVGYWTEKQGLPAEWARRYWRAHWQLPSPQMAYEMLHRGVINRDTMELLLRIADYPKFWRDKLIAISYNPYTRVDIRRMYQTGVLNKEEVFKAYKDIGYDDEHASKLTQFTVSLASTNERDLSTSDLVTAYKDKIIKRDVLVYNLKLSGYDENEAELIASKADYDINREWRKGILDSLKTRFLNNDLTLDQINTLMHSYNFTADEISYYTALWQLEYSTKFSKLSLNDLFELYRNAIINKDQLDYELRRLGYNAQHRDWLKQLADTQRKVFL